MLTTRGKQVKEIVLNNLSAYSHQKIQQAERKMAALFNEHPVETKGKGMNVGSSAEIVARYDECIEEVLKWKKYRDTIEELK